MSQIVQINEKLRYLDLKQDDTSLVQTKASFDYQWKYINEGRHLPSDQNFIDHVGKNICEMTTLSADWFKGKTVLDAGCGIGRFTYGLLTLGAHVTAIDYSASAIKQAEELCAPYADHLKTLQSNLLDDMSLFEQYDLVFSFGVVHHTGNTYLAMKNVCDRVKVGGKVFFMIYGFPEKAEDFQELNNYERLRAQLHGLPFSEKYQKLSHQFPEQQVHGWFDAVSPEINDLLTYQECTKLLTSFGFEHIHRTTAFRNLHIIASKIK